MLITTDVRRQLDSAPGGLIHANSSHGRASEDPLGDVVIKVL